MKSSFGKNIKITIWGGSHEKEIGVSIEGFPEDISIDYENLQGFLNRRAPGRSPFATGRKEDDIPVLKSKNPLTFIIENKDQRSSDYKKVRNIPRPGHADYTAKIKYGDSVNMAGGGPFSARMTAPLCIAGGIAKNYLEEKGIKIHGTLSAVGGVTGSDMLPKIEEAMKKGDSVGGIVHATVTGCPAGIGGAMYGGLESFISPIIFGIPAVKGLSFGNGFDSAEMFGSQNNDPFIINNGSVETGSNNAGGILGGITTGMPITLDVAFKPTPSISISQKTVDLDTMAETTLITEGRHDPCVAFRATPIVEAAVALGILDAILEDNYEFR